jgi:hypothetical protein
MAGGRVQVNAFARIQFWRGTGGRGSEIGNGRTQKRRGMTAAQKAEVSKRMKAYWAARRRSKGDK